VERLKLRLRPPRRKPRRRLRLSSLPRLRKQLRSPGLLRKHRLSRRRRLPRSPERLRKHRSPLPRRKLLRLRRRSRGNERYCC
jgi:hypothetical protein